MNNPAIQATPQTLRLIRTIPTTIKDFIEIGFLAFGYAAQSITITLTINLSAIISITKKYFIVMTYNRTGSTWNTIYPLYNVNSGTEDVEIIMRVINGTAEIRLLRTAGTSAGTATIDIDMRTTDYDTRFSPASGTGTQGRTGYEIPPYDNGETCPALTNTLLGGTRRKLNDWPNDLNVPIIPDPTYPSLLARLFPNYAVKAGWSEGYKNIGLTVVIPAAVTNIILTAWCRCDTAPGASNNACFLTQGRNINSGAAPGGWTLGTRYDMAFANNAYYQVFTDIHTLADVGLIADRIALINWGRDASNGFESCQKDVYCCSLQITFS